MPSLYPSLCLTSLLLSHKSRLSSETRTKTSSGGSLVFVAFFLLCQSFAFGDVVEVKGLAVAVPEGVVVELNQPHGGFVFQRHGSRALLEEVEALKVNDHVK